MVDGWVLAAENPLSNMVHPSTQRKNKVTPMLQLIVDSALKQRPTGQFSINGLQNVRKLVTYRVREEVGIKPEALSSLALQSLSKLDVAPATLSQNNGRR
jgi:hypothetical protein